MQSCNSYVIEYRIGNVGCRLIKHHTNAFSLYYISGEYDVEFGFYDSFDVAIECTEALMETLRNPS